MTGPRPLPSGEAAGWSIIALATLATVVYALGVGVAAHQIISWWVRRNLNDKENST